MRPRDCRSTRVRRTRQVRRDLVRNGLANREMDTDARARTIESVQAAKRDKRVRRWFDSERGYLWVETGEREWLRLPYGDVLK